MLILSVFLSVLEKFGQIRNHSEVRNKQYLCVGVVINRHDMAGGLYAGEVLSCSVRYDPGSLRDLWVSKRGSQHLWHVSYPGGCQPTAANFLSL